MQEALLRVNPSSVRNRLILVFKNTGMQCFPGTVRKSKKFCEKNRKMLTHLLSRNLRSSPPTFFLLSTKTRFLSLFYSLSLSLSLSRTHTLSLSLTLTHTHTLNLSLSLTLSLAHTHSHTLSLSLSSALDIS